MRLNYSDNGFNFVNDLKSVFNVPVWCLFLCQVTERINLVVLQGGNQNGCCLATMPMAHNHDIQIPYLLIEKSSVVLTEKVRFCRS